MFEEATDLGLIESPGALDIVAQQGFQDVQGGGVAADLGDQFQELMKTLRGPVAVDVPERELDQSG